MIGPAGVFSLNTKNLTGEVWVAERTLLHNGYRTDYLPKSSREAVRAARFLSAAVGRPVLVRGVLVLMCDRLTVKAQPIDVAVVARRQLNRWLLRQPGILGQYEVSELGSKAEGLGTWSGRPRRQ